MNYFEMKWRLSACRIQAGYSQAEVAEILGCSDKTIVSWETGKTAPKMEKAQEFIQFEIDAIEGARAERKDKPKHEDFMDAMLRGLFGGSVGHIEITGKRNGKTDEEIAEIVDKTIKDIISGMAGVELEEIKEGNGYTEVHITGNANPIEVREYIERELKDRLAMVL